MRTSTHPKLQALLDLHEISVEDFDKLGRVPASVSEKRSLIVTSLHLEGMPWTEMVKVTGKSHGFVQRNTRACWNESSRDNRKANAVRTGKMGLGVPKPYMSAIMKQRWEGGFYEPYRSQMGGSWTLSEDTRAIMSGIRVSLWRNPEYRNRLLAYHRSPEERAHRSLQQSIRYQNNPGRFLRGKSSTHISPKCRSGAPVLVRSTYEARAFEILHAREDVISFDFEPSFQIPDRDGVVRRILPDFLVYMKTGNLLIEVKAAWVLSQPPDSKVQVRLGMEQALADRMGWSFEIWEESKLWT